MEYVYSLLEEQGPLDPRRMQIKLTGFLEDKTPKFMSELWALMLSAQDSLGGIPKAFLEDKKREILAKKVHRSLLVVFCSRKSLTIIGQTG